MTLRTRLFAKTASAAALALLGLAHPAAANGFQTPSGNITCYLDVFNDQVAFDEMALNCLIFQADWQAPLDFGDDDPTCDLDRTRIVILPPKGAGSARLVCHGDVFWPYPQGALSYGSTWSLPTFSCGVAQDGVRCRNGDGRGFHLRRAAVTFD